MTFIKNLEDMKCLCRICLTASDNMVSIHDPVDDKLEDSPHNIDILENILMVEIESNNNFPVEICHLCRGSLKILYDLKFLFNKSQSILKKYESTLQQFESMDHVEDNTNISCSSLYNSESESEVSSHGDVNDTETVLQHIPEENPENSHEDVNAIESVLPPTPEKNVKIQIDIKKKNTIKVKWMEGNKFLVEKNENSEAIHKCKHCNKIFLSEEKLIGHTNICRKYISCKFCKKKFYSERGLRSHLKMHHGSNSPFEIKCDLCGQTFKNHNARSYHKITRHNTEGKRHTCEICGKAFYFKNSLNQHLECHSRDVSRVVCPICGKSFHYRGGLFYHMKIHRNERNYICSFCDGRFLNMASLKRHTRIHTGERPYTCSYCPKTFCSISEVRTHEKRHTGQKPHSCKYCKKSFLTPYNLKLHMSSHTGAQPCYICGKSYLNAEVLKYHLEMKHNIKEHNSEEIVI